LPALLKATHARAHVLRAPMLPIPSLYPPPIVAVPLESCGELATAKGEKALKVYPLPVPRRNWIGEPVFRGYDGKPLWRLSVMPREFGYKLDTSVGADRTLWAANDMVWFEGDGCFTGPEGMGLFKPHIDNACLGISGRDIGIIRFIAPESGRYTVSVKSGPWGCWMCDDKSMSLSVLRFATGGGPGEPLAFQKDVKKESKGLAMEVEARLMAGEELAFVPDVDAWSGDWYDFRLTIGLLPGG